MENWKWKMEKWNIATDNFTLSVPTYNRKVFCQHEGSADNVNFKLP